VKHFVLAALLIGLTSSVNARLNIEITQGTVAGVPIAVINSSEETAQRRTGMGASFEELANVVRNDLKMCGRFEPLFPEQLPRVNTVSQELDAGLWQQVGVENVVLGVVKPEGSDHFGVTFKLLDVYKAQGNQSALKNGELTRAENTVLLNKTYHGVSRKDFRALAHRISDDIYEKLTGIRGAFSTRIAYVMVVRAFDGTHYSLEVADADGHNPVTLVKSKEPLMSPSWSPDARQIAFVSFEKNRAEIYLIEVATGKRRLLSKFPGINGAPAWSPNGRQLAVVLSKEGSPKIYLWDMDTQNIQQITDGYSIDTEPAWSKDGRSLYFTSNRGGKPQIYRMDMAGRKIDRVTFVGNYNARPMLTSDGRYLVMMHREEGDRRFHIASQELSTGQVSVLTHAALDESPTLSPNGAMVLYGTREGDRQILSLVTLDGRGQLRLPAREGSVQEPAWSPFLS